MKGDFIKEVIITLDMAQQEGIMMIIYHRNTSMYMVSYGRVLFLWELCQQEFNEKKLQKLDEKELEKGSHQPCDRYSELCLHDFYIIFSPS